MPEEMSVQNGEKAGEIVSKRKRKRKLPEWMTSGRHYKTTQSEHSNKNNSSSLPDQFDLESLEFTGSIFYSSQPTDCAALCQDIRDSLADTSRTAIGFDMEWPVSFQRGQKEQKVALVQLCLDDKKCFLFHLSAIGGFPKPLAELLYDEKATLVGVGIESDFWKLERDFDLDARKLMKTQCMDLSHMANNVLKSSERWSLENLCRNLFLRSINKDRNVRCSNWAQFPLEDSQKLYAATDAYVSLLIHRELVKRKSDLRE